MKKILAIISLVCLLAPHALVLADASTIDPNNVGNILMTNSATMGFGTTGTVLSSSGLVIAGIATSSANMYTAIGDQAINTTADAQVFNTTAGGYVGTTTLPANFLTIGRKFTVTGAGVYSTPLANTSTATLKIQMASSTYAATIASVVTPALVQSASAWEYHWEYTCTVRSVGVTGTIQCDGVFYFSTTATGADTSADLSGLGTIDTTHSLTLKASNAWSTVSGGQAATEKETGIDWNN